MDLRDLPARTRAVVYAWAAFFVAAAFGVAYAVYRNFGPPRNEYDLRIYYDALQSWHSGNGLYSFVKFDAVNGPLGFTYPPAAALAMSPMTAFGMRTVVVLSSAAIFAATVAVVLLSLRERLTLRRPQMIFASGLATALAFCLQPISQTEAFGQVNTFLALLVMFDLLVLTRRGSRWVGIGIGLAIAIKLTPAIFLLYFVLSRRWRPLVTASLTAIGATLVAAAYAPSETWQYFTSLLWDSGRIGVLDNTANQSINGTLARFSSSLPPDKTLWALCALVVIGIGAVRIRQAVAANDVLLAVTATGLIGVLVSPVSWVHHAVWVVPAMVVLVSRLLLSWPFSRGATGPEMRRWWGIAFLTATGFFVFFLNTRAFFGLPDAGYSQLGLAAIIEGSLQTLWMVAALIFLPVGAGLTPGRSTSVRRRNAYSFSVPSGG